MHALYITRTDGEFEIYQPNDIENNDNAPEMIRLARHLMKTCDYTKWIIVRWSGHTLKDYGVCIAQSR